MKVHLAIIAMLIAATSLAMGDSPTAPAVTLNYRRVITTLSNPASIKLAVPASIASKRSSIV